MQLLHAIVGCVIAVCPAIVCLAQPPAQMARAKSFDQELVALESSWSEGGNVAYFARAAELADGLATQAGAQTDSAGKLLEVLVRRKVESVEVGTADLSAKAKLARQMLREDDVGKSIGARAEEVKPLAMLLGAVREEVLPNFSAKRVTMNVRPPRGSGPGVSGMDPDAIADPVARERYKAAILENRRNAMLNSRQRLLRDMEADFAPPIVDLMRQFANQDSVGLSLVQEWVRTARLTGVERSIVLSSPAQ